MYPDGVPNFTDTVVDGEGDGTVPIQSALGGGLVVNKLQGDFGAHSQLMGAYKVHIRTFLQGECPQ